jgi:hypothetical protein
MRLGVLRFVLGAALLAFTTPSSDSQEGQAKTQNGAATASADVQTLEAYLDIVGKAKEAAQQAWDALRASTQSQGGLAESDFVTEWLAAASTNGAGASPFYAGTQSVLNSWITALKSGADASPPSDEIRAGMEKWQEAHANILDSLQQAAALEKTLRAGNARLAKMKPESPEWLFYKDQQQQQQLTQRKLLSDAGSSLASAAAIPAPITDADRTQSPFAGATTPGTPDRLFLHLRRASALIGSSIALQIGFANDRGPNVAADRNYSVALSCEGCTATPSTVQLSSGKTFAQAQVKITAPAARIHAEVKGSSSRADAIAYGCYSAPTVALAAEQDRQTGPADAVTPIPFRFAFHDASGQRATDGTRKHLTAKLTGIGQLMPLDSSVASMRAKDGTMTIAADECVAEGGVVSPLAGAAKLSADYNSRQVGPLEFRFLYAFPWLDKICVALGALFAFIAGYSILKTRPITWVASAIASVVGAAVVFTIGYFYVLNTATFEDTWVAALGLAAIGGVLGVVVAKLVLPRYMPTGDVEHLPPTPNL